MEIAAMALLIGVTIARVESESGDLYCRTLGQIKETIARISGSLYSSGLSL